MTNRYCLLSIILGCLIVAHPAAAQHVQQDRDQDTGRLVDHLRGSARSIPTHLQGGAAAEYHAAESEKARLSPTSALVWLLSEQISQDWNADTGEWVNESRVTYSRNAAGGDTGLLIEDWDAASESWVPETRRQTERDAQNRITEFVFESWEEDANNGEGGWVPAQRQSYSYNSQGNTLVSTTEFWNEDTESLQIIWRTTWTYDGTGEIVLESLFESALFGPLSPSVLTTYTYGQDGQTTEELSQTYDSATEGWNNSSLELFSYDANGEVVEEIEQGWDPVAGDWVNEDRTFTTYNPDSNAPNEIIETDQVWDPAADGGNGAWINDEREVTTYVPNAQNPTEIVDTEQEWDSAADGGNGAWVNVERSTDRFTGSGDYVETVNETWDGAWVNEGRGTVERDENNLPVVNLWEVWDGAAWVNDNRLLMSFEEFTGTAAEDIPAGEGFRLEANYPNPFRDATTIRFTLSAPEHVTLEVFDLLGRHVTTLVDAVTPSGRHEISLDGTGLAGGLYVYRLRGDAVEASRTMMLVR